mmetsp:Transcript_92713/g.241876  ORF Transcript_92713/g.241876 Transcript_92713/m.241876 type:complete len:254 (-) Transcript_92713:4-765(-)
MKSSRPALQRVRSWHICSRSSRGQTRWPRSTASPSRSPLKCPRRWRLQRRRSKNITSRQLARTSKMSAAHAVVLRLPPSGLSGPRKTSTFKASTRPRQRRLGPRGLPSGLKRRRIARGRLARSGRSAAGRGRSLRKARTAGWCLWIRCQSRPSMAPPCRPWTPGCPSGGLFCRRTASNSTPTVSSCTCLLELRIPRTSAFGPNLHMTRRRAALGPRRPRRVLTAIGGCTGTTRRHCGTSVGTSSCEARRAGTS